MSVDVVILAGGDGAIIDPACRFKGLFRIADKPMVEWVVDAAKAATTVHEVAVVVPTAESLGPWVDTVDKLVVSAQPFMDNVIAGVTAFRSERPVLIVTGDVPLLTGEAIDDFTTRALARSADFSYPLVPKEDMTAAFPAGQRTYFRLATGSFTGGNMALVNPEAALDNREMGQRLFELRKSALQLVRILGVGFAGKFLLGRLRPEEVEAKMEQLVGHTGAAVVTRYASVGMDVDKPADVAIVEPMLRALGNQRAHNAG